MALQNVVATTDDRQTASELAAVLRQRVAEHRAADEISTVDPGDDTKEAAETVADDMVAEAEADLLLLGDIRSAADALAILILAHANLESGGEHPYETMARIGVARVAAWLVDKTGVDPVDLVSDRYCRADALREQATKTPDWRARSIPASAACREHVRREIAIAEARGLIVARNEIARLLHDATQARIDFACEQIGPAND